MSVRPEQPVITNVTKVDLAWRKPCTLIEFQGAPRPAEEPIEYSIEIIEDSTLDASEIG